MKKFKKKRPAFYSQHQGEWC